MGIGGYCGVQDGAPELIRVFLHLAGRNHGFGELSYFIFREPALGELLEQRIDLRARSIGDVRAKRDDTVVQRAGCIGLLRVAELAIPVGICKEKN